MLKIGITGGIGSGKSTVAGMFAVLGIPVYFADDAAKRLMNTDPRLMADIRLHFGDAAYTPEGQLDRKYLGNIVFNDPQRLALLNTLTHPATIRDSASWAEKQTTPYVIKEAAILFETGSNHYLDEVIGVSAPKALRIQRVMERDHVTREEVLARMRKQIDEDIKMRLSDHIIFNDEQQLVIPQVLALHEKLLARAKA
ncbi:dephospho-CoA kinase [Chitinophaga costaii]|uniref:Dephospho-CoA kinase n=1 Tax=Chitinophaga costaii TaxID=1335309 RepID=A0A1C4E7C0_9BACT|nr:dephospho-CoA kinase [Chitinophaga costaii]PUZ24277.1 dephospho-CoA kinase [Chitinophaga costaii]SCC39415.1 dephospho-CoA kinase [Chitinophaga costaii]